MPILTVIARSYHRFVPTYFIRILSSKTEHFFESVRSQVKSTTRISSSISAIEQCNACVNATRRIFKTSYIEIDELHLNQNQLKNCRAWGSVIGQKPLVEQIIRDFSRIRIATEQEHYTILRGGFERKYFFCFPEKPLDVV